MRMNRRHARASLFIPAVLIVIACSIGASIYTTIRAYRAPVISPLPDPPELKKPRFRLFAKEKNPDTLKERIRKAVASQWTNYSVYVADYNSSFTMGINETIMYTAASVNKVPILVAAYNGIQNGSIDPDQIITVQPDDIQDYGTGKIRYDPPGTTYSIKTLIQLMMQQSDNTAAYILANHIIGLEAIQTYINGLGLKQTDIVNNKTSNRDMSVLFAKIYHKTLTNEALADEMLGMLTNSDFEDRLPGKLPKNATVYHKIGTGQGVVHDIGNVVSPESAYYIGVFSSDITDEEQAAELVATVSKIVFDFINAQ